MISSWDRVRPAIATIDATRAIGSPQAQSSASRPVQRLRWRRLDPCPKTSTRFRFVARAGTRRWLLLPGVQVAESYWLPVRSVADRGSLRSGEVVGPSFHVLGRLGETHEVADVVEFLLSDRSSYINGETILADVGVRAA